ncbi:MAG: glucosyl-3-phosphoglycerate synthase [Actinobacteria bacterium]|nr:glucosyl-3-phosphoglycerate synthase [Actinomycetota bacterium]
MSDIPGRVSVCLPARDEARTVGAIVRTIRRELIDSAAVGEVVVVDDGSTDATATEASAAGARVVAADGSTPGSSVGKGAALRTGLAAAHGDVVVFCDADITNFSARFVTGLLAPLSDPSIQFVKGYYDRPLQGRNEGGGRVTELVARPVVSLLFPHLRHIRQPLAGEFAGRREALEAVEIEPGYAVDLALLIDLAARFGVDSIAQADLGVRFHRNRTLAELSEQSVAILAMAFDRVGFDVGDRAGLLSGVSAGGRGG